MSDDLMFPSVPEPKPEDPEDVSWALSTAEAMWARGDHSEGIKWVRRAAEAASEAEDDGRALELAKVAADLAGLISKHVSRASIDIEEVVPMSEPQPQASANTGLAAQPPPVPPKPPPRARPKPAPTAAAATDVASPTLDNAPKPIGAVTRQTSTPSRPPAPLPSRTSQPPSGKGKPLGTNTGRPPSLRPGAPTGTGPESKKDGKRARRSRENLQAEAQAAGAVQQQATIETAKQLVVDENTAARVLSETGAIDTTVTDVAEIPRMPERPKRPGGDDPTTISHVNEVQLPKRSTDEWDADMTQNLTGDDFPLFANDPNDEGERMTAVGIPPADFKSTLQSFPRPGAINAIKTEGAPIVSSVGTTPPATVAAVLRSPLAAPPGFGPPARPASTELHDPKITTTQAVRVVVWRDTSGVHVAPAGTVVSAITVDAVLVALEPNADLTAWLTLRGR